MGNIDDVDRPDLIVLHIDNPAGGNTGYYRIGWNIDTKGNIADGNWTKKIGIPDWWGAYSSGGGITVGHINDNDILDLIVTHIDNPNGENKGYYRIGWNIDKDGNIDTWGNRFNVVGWVGDLSQGAGITVGNIDDYKNLDLIFFHIDNPAGGNHGYYRVGLNMNDIGAILPFKVDKNGDKIY